MVILETLKNALIGISPFYNLGIMIFTAFLLVFFAASRSKGLKVFSLVILSTGISVSLVFDLIALGEGQNASNFLFNIGSMEYIQIAVLLVIMLVVVIFFSLYNFETKVFGRTLLFFNGVIIGLSFLVVSRDFIAIFSSLTLTVLFLFFIVSVNNRGDQEVSYRVLRFFIRPGISLGLVFLGFSFIYGATDFKIFNR